MRIATYNIWNHETLDGRLDALCEDIGSLRADVIVLQEAAARTPGHPSKPIAHYIAEQTGYPHTVFRAYPELEDSDEGLAILSSYPFESEMAIWDGGTDKPVSCAIRAVVKAGSIRIAVTNVHLDWRSVLNREKQICAVLDWVNSQMETNAAEIMAGDFNDVPDSSIHRLLQGCQSLNGRAAKRLDLAEYEEWRTGLKAGATLDFAHNPRWHGVHTLQIPARVDWIMLRQEPRDPEPIVRSVRLFGTKTAPVAQKVPSDHYGVAADLHFA